MPIKIQRHEVNITRRELLEQKHFPDWDAAMDFLASKVGDGIRTHRPEFEANPEIYFDNPMPEMVCSGIGGYSTHVTYAVTQVQESGEDIQVEPRPFTTPAAAEAELARSETVRQDLAPAPHYRCKACGVSGNGRAYPFSTNPGSGYCDDCGA